MQQFLNQSRTAVIIIAYNSLEGNISSKIVELRVLVAKPADEMQFIPI